MTPREFGQHAARAATLAVVVIATLEGAMRLDDWARFGVPFASRIISLGELLTTDSLGVHARPGAQFRQFRINQLGFRGAEIGEEQLRLTRLVVAAGASETFGLYEPAGKEWPRQLEDSLRAACSESITVGNAAFAGMSLPTVIQDIQRRLAPLQPSAIVYYPTPMQYLEKELPIAAEPSRSVAATPKGFRFRAFVRFRDAIKRILPAPVLDRLRQREIRAFRRELPAGPLDRAPLERLDRFEQDLRVLVGAVRSVGATSLLVVHQNRFFSRDGDEQARWLTAWERFYPLYTGEAILDFDRLAAERTRKVAKDSAVRLVDPALELKAARPVPFADFSHFTEQGSAIVGGAVARALSPGLCQR